MLKGCCEQAIAIQQPDLKLTIASSCWSTMYSATAGRAVNGKKRRWYSMLAPSGSSKYAIFSGGTFSNFCKESWTCRTFPAQFQKVVQKRVNAHGA